MAEDAEGVEAARRVREPGGVFAEPRRRGREEERRRLRPRGLPGAAHRKEDGSVADSEDSGVLVEAPVEREK